MDNIKLKFGSGLQLTLILGNECNPERQHVPPGKCTVACVAWLGHWK